MTLLIPNVGENSLLKEVMLPKRLSVDLAELVGIHFGDGNLYKNKKYNYVATYCFNSKEKWLHKHTFDLFEKLFCVKLKEREIKSSAISLSLHSKAICYYLHKNFNLPFGRKEHLTVPKSIKSNKKYLIAFLRGLYWTDGCMFIKKDGKYRYPIIKITAKSKSFIIEIQEILNQLGFRAKINAKGTKWGGFDVVLHGKKQVSLWEELIIRSGDTGIRISE